MLREELIKYRGYILSLTSIKPVLNQDRLFGSKYKSDNPGLSEYTKRNVNLYQNHLGRVTHMCVKIRFILRFLIVFHLFWGSSHHMNQLWLQ